MRRILFLSENYYPYLSGVPVVVKYLAEGLAIKGWRVTVATSIEKGSTLLSRDILNGVEIQRYCIWRDFSKRLHGDIKGLQHFVLNGEFDVVIVECGQAITTDAVLPVLSSITCPILLHAHGLSGLLGKPFAIKSDFKHSIGASYNWLRMQWYYGHTFKRVCRYFDASISLTPCDSGSAYLRKHVHRNFVLGNAADDIFFDKPQHRYQLPFDGKPYLISIANYTVVKNQLQMLRQFYMCERSVDYALVMIGSQSTSYYRELIKENERLSVKFGERKVLMLIGVDRKYFPSLLDGASLYLVSSTYEEYSISIIEAMSRGVPFVSTDVGNSRMLPGGITLESISDMHTAIDRLLSNEQERYAIGKAGRKYAYEHCRIEAVVNLLEEIINNV